MFCDFETDYPHGFCPSGYDPCVGMAQLDGPVASGRYEVWICFLSSDF